ncbi:MAG: efflux RND transporter periplasmic adaptor subunit [Syntrophobacteraceae bacterium]
MPASGPHKWDTRVWIQSERGGVRWILLLGLIVVIGLGVVGYHYRDALRGSKLGSRLFGGADLPPGAVYYCPMHPQIQSDKPGTCPICNMNLEKMEAEKAPPESKQTADGKVVYYCPMHPQIQSDKPGTCPICNMSLEKMGESDEHGGHGAEGAMATVRISPQKQQLIGIQVGEATRSPLSSTIRAVGRLVYNETRIARIQTKIEGWIEQVFVDFTGIAVKKGQPLATVYSPQLYSTQRELIIAKKSRDVLGDSQFEEVASGARSLYEATRQRLKLWDISDAQIREIERKGSPSRAMTIFSPLSGFVVTKNVFAGQRITPETELYTVADLSSIWVLADVYEYEIPMVRVGQSAVMTLAYNPGKSLTGKVSYIYPELDKTTRTLKVRLEFPNPDLALKPDMYANVEIRVDHGSNLSLPQEAVLDSGMDQIVFVALEDGYFEPRKVELGSRVGDRFIVLGGLKAGEKVVTSGNFLVDSESQLKAVLKSMTGGPAKGDGTADSKTGADGGAPPSDGKPAEMREGAPHRHP